MESIRQLFGQFGITEVGVCPFAAFENELLACRAKNRIPQGAKSIVVFLMSYLQPSYAGPRNLAKYAVVPDYHRVASRLAEELLPALEALFPGERFALFADNSPIPEVRAACAAGLGVLGLNGLVINPVYGSYVFVGEIATTLSLPPNVPEHTGCIGCGACIRACPAGCLQPGGRDITRCLSFLTQKKGALTPEEEAAVRKGGLIWGCDVCQDVCPMNRSAQPTRIPLLSEDLVAFVEAGQIDALCKTRAFGFRGPAVLRRNIGIVHGAPAHTITAEN